MMMILFECDKNRDWNSPQHSAARRVSVFIKRPSPFSILDYGVTRDAVVRIIGESRSGGISSSIADLYILGLACVSWVLCIQI